jgi:c-di-GMP-binding flagellar brake protein YcgR
MDYPGTKQTEKRRYPRCQAPVLVRCQVRGAGAALEVHSVGRDVSLAGIRFPVMEQLRGGEMLDMTMELSASQRPVRAEGAVRWVREFSRIGRPQYEVGVEFTDLEGEDRRRLSAFCNRWFTSQIPTSI